MNRRFNFFTACLCVGLYMQEVPAFPAADVRTTAPHSTAIGELNGNLTIVQGRSNKSTKQIIDLMNELKRQNALSKVQIDDLVKKTNILLKKLDEKNSLSQTNQTLDDLISRLTTALNSPSNAQIALKPFLNPSFDLSNSSYTANEFLDAYGRSLYKLTFSISGDCNVFIDPPRGAGFTVGYGILSDHGSRIFASLLGTQPKYRPISLSTGIYQFVMKATRGAGQYSATISAQCS